MYDDLLPDERTRLHAELADDPPGAGRRGPGPRPVGAEPAGLPLVRRARPASRPGGIGACGRGGLDGRRSRGVTHLERALSLWDRVPDAEARGRLHQIELLLTLARAASDQGDLERWHGPTAGRSTCWSPAATPWSGAWLTAAWGSRRSSSMTLSGARDAIRLAVEDVDDSPGAAKAIAYARGAQALLHNVDGRFAAGLEAPRRRSGPPGPRGRSTP